ncbi:cysteine rich repeat-containing protein [Camelimonas sp. ID_303_24]
MTVSSASAQEGDLAKYCPSDIKRLCANVQPGGGRIMKCLKQHSKEISVGCAQALQKMKG